MYVCIQMLCTLCVRAMCHQQRTGGGYTTGWVGIWGVVFYIKAIVLLPQLHVTSIYSATRLCYLSGPPSTPSSPALTSQK